jgi:hypothetical protein
VSLRRPVVATSGGCIQDSPRDDLPIPVIQLAVRFQGNHENTTEMGGSRVAVGFRTFELSCFPDESRTRPTMPGP